MRFLTRTLLLTIIAIIFVAGGVRSGEQLRVFTGEAVADQLGFRVASAGDVNNDGYDDLIVGAPFNDGGGENAGRAYVFSGLDGDTLYIFSGDSEWEQVGYSVASAGDVNNDGFADLIISAPFHDAGGESAGRAIVISGINGDTLHIFTGAENSAYLGRSAASAGDVNNDGFDDLIVGAPGNDAGEWNNGRVYVFSGLNGDTLYIFSGAGKHDNFGWSVASAGDVNNDGFSDLIVGAWGNAADAGRAYVFSGMNGDTLFVFTGEANTEHLGISAASAGDVNNDGYSDLIVGASGYANQLGDKVGRAFVFSGLDGDTLYTFTGEAEVNFFGNSVASAGDVDNDGCDDLIVGAYCNSAAGKNAGRVYVFSGLDGDTLLIFTGEAERNQLGVSVSSAGDVNNDGIMDLIVGANQKFNFGVGIAHVYSGAAAEGCCEGLAGSVDGDPEDLVNISDLTMLIDHLFINFPVLPCPQEGNVTGDLAGVVDIADLTYLIDHLFINFPPTAHCQSN